MGQIWYIYFNEVVSGPFSTESIESGLAQNKWSMDALIWWKGQREWVAIDDWRKDLKNIQESIKTNAKTTAWYVEHLGAQKGPMNAKELHSYVQSNGIGTTCRVWAEGMERWMNIFEINELVQLFGITRRKHDRAPFSGELIVKNESNPEILIAKAGSISAGGLGARGLDKVQKGESLSIQINSPLLIKEISSSAKVVYSNPGGFTGLEFEKLQPNFASIINDYVKQFK